MPLNKLKLGVITVSIMTLGITTVSIRSFCIIMLSMVTLNIGYNT
jgi:hypothetical protein